ncbi:MAG: hypothetical protein V3T22_09790 [Planctomycetota bacterium]
MSSRGQGSEVWANGLDPSTALTVGEAARLAGVSEATVRKRIQSGRLLHEVGRRGGRGVQLVRLVDLADVYPELTGRDPEPQADPTRTREPALDEGRAADPRAAGPRAADPRAHGPRAHGPETAGPETTGTEAGGTEAVGPETEPGAGFTAGAAGVPGDGHGSVARQHAFEVRLASLQVGNDGLGAQVRELQVQRADLKVQCDDLRTRLSSVERERQAGTAGLLIAQRRLLELEVAGPVVQLGPAWWRRSSTWGLGVALLLVGGSLGLEIHGSRTARAAAREDASELEGRLVELASDLDAVQKSGSRSLERWTSERAGWQAERLTLEQGGAAGEERELELGAQLQAARAAAQEDRRLLAESLSEARALTGAVREELTREREESRAERTHSAELQEQRARVAAELLQERERALAAERAAERAATERALADLGQRAQASAEAAETLAGELAQRRIEEQRQTALLLEEIERLGARLPAMPALPPTAQESVPHRDSLQDERARRWLFGLHLPGMFQTLGEGGR